MKETADSYKLNYLRYLPKLANVIFLFQEKFPHWRTIPPIEQVKLSICGINFMWFDFLRFELHIFQFMWFKLCS